MNIGSDPGSLRVIFSLATPRACFHFLLHFGPHPRCSLQVLPISKSKAGFKIYLLWQPCPRIFWTGLAYLLGQLSCQVPEYECLVWAYCNHARETLLEAFLLSMKDVSSSASIWKVHNRLLLDGADSGGHVSNDSLQSIGLWNGMETCEGSSVFQVAAPGLNWGFFSAGVGGCNRGSLPSDGAAWDVDASLLDWRLAAVALASDSALARAASAVLPPPPCSKAWINHPLRHPQAMQRLFSKQVTYPNLHKWTPGVSRNKPSGSCKWSEWRALLRAHEADND